jgi:predicted Zn-ribbon and HTH transcriptional regulator
MKNTIYVVTIVACIAVAIVVFVKTQSRSSGGLESIKRGEEMYWVKCNNPKCKAEYQIDKRDYHEQIDEKMKSNPLSLRTPALICKQCGQPSVYKAIKCEKCGIVFFEGTSTDFPDRCPECGYSKTETSRKERLAQRGK